MALLMYSLLLVSKSFKCAKIASVFSHSTNIEQLQCGKRLRNEEAVLALEELPSGEHDGFVNNSVIKCYRC